MSTEIVNSKKTEYSLFKTTRRIALIFFLGFTLFLTASTVMLIFLTKPDKEVKVPDVVGKKFINVHNGLVRSGIRPILKFREVFDFEDGIILGQYPPNGSIISENSNIKLIISRSKIELEVPNLIGTELPVALNKLKNLHSHGKAISISAGVISYLPSETRADNIVIGQSPNAGSIITPESKINLLISAGKLKQGRRMPSVVGQSIDLCYDLLASKGVIVSEEIVKTQNIKKSGIVLSQFPRKSSFIKKGSTVKLKVYWYPLKEHPYSAYEIVEYIIPNELKSGFYEATIEDKISKRIRFSARMNPGQHIKFIFHRVGNAKVKIQKDNKNIRIISINVEEFN